MRSVTRTVFALSPDALRQSATGDAAPPGGTASCRAGVPWGGAPAYVRWGEQDRSFDHSPKDLLSRVGSKVWRFEIIARTTAGNNTAVESCFRLQ